MAIRAFVLALVALAGTEVRSARAQDLQPVHAARAVGHVSGVSARFGRGAERYWNQKMHRPGRTKGGVGGRQDAAYVLGRWSQPTYALSWSSRPCDARSHLPGFSRPSTA